MTPTARRGGPRVAVFAFLDLSDGGAQRLTLAAARHMDRARYRPVFLCARGGGPLVGAARASGVGVDELGRLRRSWDVPAVAAIARRLRDLDAFVLHVPLYSRASPYFRLAARLSRTPLVVAHEWCRPGPPSRTRASVDRMLAPGTRFVAASHAQHADLVDAGIDPDAIAVIDLGIDLDRFAPLAAGAARAALGLPAERRVVLVPARLHPMKGHVDLLAAVSLVRRHVPDVLVLCAGDGPLRDVLPALAASAGLGDCVRWLGQRDDMPVLLGAADVVALASHIEGLPAAIMEAFAAGRAVVATAVGGVPEVVRDGETGWLAPARDPRALAAALSDALLDRAARAARVARARQVAADRFDVRDGAVALQAAYDRWAQEVGSASGRAGAPSAPGGASRRPPGPVAPGGTA